MQSRRVTAWLIAVLCALLLGAAALGGLYGLRGLLESTADVRDAVATVESLILSWGHWGMLASIGLMIVHSFVPFPAEILAIANGMLYGPVLGTALTWVGGMLGALLAFGCARLLGRPFVERMVATTRLEQIDRWTRHHGGITLLLARLIPVIAFNLLNYGAGLTSMSWWTFTWATAIGILPMCVLMATVGSSILEWPAWVWITLTVALAVMWLLVRQFRAKSAGRTTPGSPG